MTPLIYCHIIAIAVPSCALQQGQSSVTFTHADGAALPVLPIAVAAVLVAGEGGTLDAATHLTAVLVPPEGTTITKKNQIA